MVEYGDKVVIIAWSDPLFIFSIENKEVSDSYKNYFELLWKNADTKTI